MIRPGENAPCGAPAVPPPFTGTLREKSYEMDLCDKCRQVLARSLGQMGIMPSVKVSGKRRAAYAGKSGAPFAAHEARTWLIEQGYDVSPSGRMSRELLNVYAAAH